MPEVILRPTLSHADNGEDFTHKLSEYATQLEQQIKALQASHESELEMVKTKLLRLERRERQRR